MFELENVFICSKQFYIFILLNCYFAKLYFFSSFWGKDSIRNLILPTNVSSKHLDYSETVLSTENVLYLDNLLLQCRFR
jgi:hypothetical protein